MLLKNVRRTLVTKGNCTALHICIARDPLWLFCRKRLQSLCILGGRLREVPLYSLNSPDDLDLMLVQDEASFRQILVKQLHLQTKRYHTLKSVLL